MKLYEEDEQRDDITPLFPEMRCILEDRLNLAGTDEAGDDEDGTDEVGTDEDEVGDGEDGAKDGEDNIIRDMINKLESPMP